MYVCANILKDQCRAQHGHPVRFPKDTSTLETGQLRAIVKRLVGGQFGAVTLVPRSKWRMPSAVWRQDR
jgi:hypothetical protein